MTPAVVVNTSNLKTTKQLIEDSFARFEAADDVFSPLFSKDNLFVLQHNNSDEPTPTIPQEVQELLRARSSQLVSITNAIYDGKSLPEGPYFAKGDNLHQAWRLYEDDLCAVVTAVIPDDDLYR